jgi:hypothetical protein
MTMIAQPHIDEFKRWARIGVDQDGIKYIPVGGMCIMSYLICIKDNSILLGKMDGENHGSLWREKWGMYIHRPSIWKEKWVIPSGFLHFGEDPEATANNLLKDMLNASAQSVKLSNVLSFAYPSKYWTGYHHWHLCFIYDVKEINLGGNTPWFSSLQFIPLNELKKENIGVAGSTVVEKLGIIK